MPPGAKEFAAVVVCGSGLNTKIRAATGPTSKKVPSKTTLEHIRISKVGSSVKIDHPALKILGQRSRLLDMHLRSGEAPALKPPSAVKKPFKVGC